MHNTDSHGFANLQSASRNPRPPTLEIAPLPDASSSHCESRASEPMAGASNLGLVTRHHGDLGQLDLGEPVVRLRLKPRRPPVLWWQ